jgi:hypothetical protein
VNSAIVTLILASAFLFQVESPLTHSSAPPSDKSWLFTPPACPLKFVAKSSSEYVFIENLSPDTVTEYAVGCVMRGERVKLVGKSEVKSITKIPPKTAEISGVEKFERYRLDCAKLKAVVGFTEVKFADGTQWKLGGVSR